MSERTRRILGTAALGLVGLVAAAGIGLAANEITGDSVGLSAEPLSAGDRLAPPEARTGPDEGAEDRRGRGRGRGGDDGERGEDGARTDDDTATSPQGGGEVDNSGPGSVDDSSGPGSGDDDDSGRGRGRGRGRGGDD